jgi:hypothetical protein
MMARSHLLKSSVADGYRELGSTGTLPKDGGVVDINRLIGFLVLALAFYFIITQPHEAAAVAHSVLYTLRAAADSMFTFFSQVL